MLVKEFSIERYGPLDGMRFSELGRFAFFFGKNERGKTLIVDALLKMLFKKKSWKRARHFGNLLRVEDQPEGYILIEKSGREHKLGSRDSINMFFDEEITLEDFRNIWVVRDSDLEIHEEAKYYTSVTERLTGIKTAEIEEIKKELQEMGNLTSPSSKKAKLTDKRDTGNIAAKLSDSRKLVEEIGALDNQLSSIGFDLLEKRLAEEKILLSRKQAEVELQKKARNREDLEKHKNELMRLRDINERLSELKPIEEEVLASWKSAMRDIEKKLDEKKDIENEEGEHKKSLERIKEELEQLERIQVETKARKVKALSLKPRLDYLRILRETLSENSRLQNLWGWGLVMTLFLCALSFLSNMVKASPVLVWLGIVWSMGFIFCAFCVFRFRRGQGKFNSLLEDLVTESKSFHEGDEELASISLSMEKTDTEFDKIENEINNKNKEKEKLRGRLDSEADIKKSLIGDISSLQEEIEELRDKTDMDSPEDLKKALHEKISLYEEKNKIEGAIASIYKVKEFNEGTIEKLRFEIDRNIRSLPSNVDYDQEEHESLKVEIEELGGKVAKFEKALQEGRKKLKETEFRVRNKEILEDEVNCRSTAELRELARKLKRFASEIEQTAEEARIAISIFEEMATKEKSRVGDLFGPEQSVSRYFREITEGSYRSVNFDPDNGKLSVESEGGDNLSVDCLSGGTLHQLYFSIRLSLGMNYLKNEKGFLILDDPFIKSDYDRLFRQLEMLRKITDAGWQVLYFSAKKEVMELLKDDVASNRVKLIHLEVRV